MEYNIVYPNLGIFATVSPCVKSLYPIGSYDNTIDPVIVYTKNASHIGVHIYGNFWTAKYAFFQFFNVSERHSGVTHLKKREKSVIV